MMNTRGRIATGLSLVLALVLGIGIGSYAAGGYGSASDPLITLSYLEAKLTPEILEQVEDMLDDDATLVILKEEGEEDADLFLAPVESDDEYEKVSEMFMERLADLFEFDVEEDD